MNAEQTKDLRTRDFLAIDVTSLATASAHDAAARVAGVAFSPSVLNWDQNCWFNGGEVVEIDAAEAAVQQLGAYVASRRKQPGGEQLFNKATELKLHSLASWDIQPVWLKACYRVFAITAFTLGSELRNAQERMRDEEELRRRASLAAQEPAAPKAEDTVMEQHADVHERVDMGSAMGTAAVGEAGLSPNEDPIEVAARAAHEANRVYCQSIGDDSQVSWADAPEWQKVSAIKGVVFAIDNNFPAPEAMHQSWCDEKIATGWVYGPEKNAELKTHPCLVAYSELPEPQRKKDDIFSMTVKQTLAELGIIKLSAGDASPVAADDAPVEGGAAPSSTSGSTATNKRKR